MLKKITLNLIKYVLAFCLLFILLTASLIAVAKIPKSAIQKNMLSSARYLSDAGMGNYLIGSIKATSTDQFADALLLNIAYNYDEKNPLKSIVWSAYSGDPSSEAGAFFLESVEHGAAPDHEYLRYWHGSNVLIRPLHLLMDLKQIYILHAIVISLLTICLMIILIKNNCVAEAISILISMAAVSIWTVPFCLEFTWVFLIMLITAIVVVMLVLDNKEHHLGLAFFVSGIITAYMDFLTAETLTFLIPILLVLRLKKHSNKSASSCWVLSMKCGIAWGSGYIGMWSSKWLLSAIVLRQDIMSYITDHIRQRQGGSIFGLSKGYFLNMYLNNIRRLFPLDYGLIGALIFLAILILLFIPVYQNKVRLKQSMDASWICLYGFLFLVPFIRFLVMHSHSSGHYFFTYRALAASVLSFCFIIMEIIEPVQRKGGHSDD